MSLQVPYEPGGYAAGSEGESLMLGYLGYLKYLFVFGLVAVIARVSAGIPAQSDEQDRMGIFLSNFTELGLYDFDIMKRDREDGRLMHLGDPENIGELVRFGVIHNFINNPKSTIRKCKDASCPYGPYTVSGKAVSASIRRYFDMSIKHQSILDTKPEIYYYGELYHFSEPDQADGDITYYCKVTDVSRDGGIFTMKGYLYDVKNPSDRPAEFTAKARSHKYNKKDTWAVLSLAVDWL